MTSKNLWRAEYKAEKIGKYLLLNARGAVQHENDIVFFEASILDVYPQAYDFWMKQQDNPVGGERQFNCRYVTPLSGHRDHVVIRDNSGMHEVPISADADSAEDAYQPDD